MGNASHTAPDRFDSLRPVAASLRPSPAPSVAPPPSPEHTLAKSPRLAKLLALIGVGMLASGTIAASPHPQPERHVGTPQIKRVQNGDPTRWHTGDIEVTLDPSLESLGKGATTAVRHAFGAWIETDAELPSLRFSLGGKRHHRPEQDGVNRVIAAPIHLEGHENDLAITVSYVSASGTILESDIVINIRHPYHLHSNEFCSQRYDLQSVATHEAGHFLGLGEDMVDENATMYFRTGRCEMKKRSLSAPDEDTVVFLYKDGWEDSIGPQVAGCSMAALGAASSSAGWGTAALLAMAAALAVRQRRTPKAHAESARKADAN